VDCKTLQPIFFVFVGCLTILFWLAYLHCCHHVAFVFMLLLFIDSAL